MPDATTQVGDKRKVSTAPVDDEGDFDEEVEDEDKDADDEEEEEVVGAGCVVCFEVMMGAVLDPANLSGILSDRLQQLCCRLLCTTDHFSDLSATDYLSPRV